MKLIFFPNFNSALGNMYLPSKHWIINEFIKLKERILKLDCLNDSDDNDSSND